MGFLDLPVDHIQKAEKKTTTTLKEATKKVEEKRERKEDYAIRDIVVWPGYNLKRGCLQGNPAYGVT